MTDPWKIITGSTANYLVHQQPEHRCGFTCKVMETQNYHCYVCGMRVPQHYVDVILLGGLYTVNVNISELYWNTSNSKVVPPHD